MFALVDCNNFYASCERVFNPALEGKPVIVLSNNDGCAIARSKEAKAIGIKMATPAFMLEDLIKEHDVKVFSSNYTLYGDMSSRVMEILSSFTPSIEYYSIDEAFLDLSELKYQDMTELAVKIRQTIKQYTGLPVTVGIAPTKTLAKLANRFAKKKKLTPGIHCLLDPVQIQEVLDHSKISEVWGIGRQHEKLLLRHHVKTAGDFIKLPDEWVRKNMSVVGQRMLNELCGIPSIKWEDQPPPKKGMCTSRSFAYLVTSKSELQEAVSTYAANVALKLRREHSCAGHMQVFLQTSPFNNEKELYIKSVDLDLPVPTNISAEIIHYALKGLDIIYKTGFKFLKAGVIVIEIIPEDQVQHGLFDTVNREKNNRLMAALDNVNKTLGKDMVRFAVQGYEKKWKLKAAYLSKRYTTNYKELLTIKI